MCRRTTYLYVYNTIALIKYYSVFQEYSSLIQCKKSKVNTLKILSNIDKDKKKSKISDKTSAEQKKIFIRVSWRNKVT